MNIRRESEEIFYSNHLSNIVTTKWMCICATNHIYSYYSLVIDTQVYVLYLTIPKYGNQGRIRWFQQQASSWPLSLHALINT